MYQEYTIEISLFQTSLSLSLDKSITILDLYSFIQDQFPLEFKKESSKNLKLYFSSKNQFLEDNSKTLQAILGNINNCKFELKEYSSGISSNDFAFSNRSISQFQAQQSQSNNNNVQAQNNLPQRQQFYFTQPQLLVQNQQNIPQVPGQNNNQLFERQGYNNNQLYQQQTNQSPNQQNQYQNQQVLNQNYFQYQNPQQQVNTNQQNYMQNQQNQNSQQIKITLKYLENQNVLEVDTDLTLDELVAHIYSTFQIDGQIEMFCGNLLLSKMDHNFNLLQAGIRNNSIIECKQQQQQQLFQYHTTGSEQNPQGKVNTDLFYQQMKFQEVPKQPNPSEVVINFEIQDGVIIRSFSMNASILLTLDQIIDSILTYLGCSREIATIDLFKGEIKIQGGKLQCTLQMLQMVTSPLSLKAKVRFNGGLFNGILC